MWLLNVKIHFKTKKQEIAIKNIWKLMISTKNRMFW